jgi:hypothetical protein
MNQENIRLSRRRERSRALLGRPPTSAAPIGALSAAILIWKCRAPHDQARVRATAGEDGLQGGVTDAASVSFWNGKDSIEGRC